MWKVADTAYRTFELNIKFLVCKKNIARRFKKISAAGFDNYIGTVNYFHIWINEPTMNGTVVLQVETSKFYCRSKHKFGLNLQGACGARSKLLIFQ